MSKLPQESEIAALQPAYVVDRVTHHDQAGEAESKRETAPLPGIDAAFEQHVRVDQAARQQFHPAALFANRAAGSATDQAPNIEFEAGLDEREIARTQPHSNFSPEDGS